VVRAGVRQCCGGEAGVGPDVCIWSFGGCSLSWWQPGSVRVVFGPCVEGIAADWSCSAVLLLLLPVDVPVVVVIVIAVPLHLHVWL
jgi:hypothetical protein